MLKKKKHNTVTSTFKPRTMYMKIVMCGKSSVLEQHVMNRTVEQTNDLASTK